VCIHAHYYMGKEYDFYDITYDFFQKEYPCNRYPIQQLRPSFSGKRDYALSTAQNTFHGQKDELQKDFRKILRLWNIDMFRHVLKKDEKYVFSSEDLKFLLKLLHNYREHPLWRKEIKKMSSLSELYKKLISSHNAFDLLEEICFVSEGFIHLYERRDLPDSQKRIFRIYVESETRYKDFLCFFQLKKDMEELLRSCFDSHSAICRQYAANAMEAFFYMRQFHPQ
jgi:hypothetical protein